MNITDFKKEIENMKIEIVKKVSEPHNNRYPITDGAVNIENYYNSPIKITWLLKEPYDDVNGEGGGWDYSELLNKNSVYEDFFGTHSSRATWHPIIYTSYGILHNFMLWNDMDYIRDDKDMSFIVREIAIINTQKLPAINMTYSNNDDISFAFDKYKDILKTQIEILNPDIIIGGSTMYLYGPLFDIKEEDAFYKESNKYFFKNNKIYIDAFHPAQRSIKRKVYIDDIILAAKEWYEKYKK